MEEDYTLRQQSFLLQVISFYTYLVTGYFVLHLSCYRLFRSTPILLQIVSFYTYLVTDYFVLHLSCYRLFRSTPILLQIVSFYTYLVTDCFVLHLSCYRLFRSTPIAKLTHALTLSLRQPTNVRAERCTDVTANSMFSGPITSTFKVLLFHD